MAKTKGKSSSGSKEKKVEEIKPATVPNQFTATVDGEEKTFEIINPKFRLDKVVYTAEEAASNKEVCETLVKIGAGNIKEIFPLAKGKKE